MELKARALRALTTMLAKEYGRAGVHVATVTVAGTVAPGTRFDPTLVAEQYWRLHSERPDAWEHEVLVDGEEAAGPGDCAPLRQ